jgi:hypothetical protein
MGRRRLVPEGRQGTHGAHLPRRDDDVERGRHERRRRHRLRHGDDPRRPTGQRGHGVPPSGDRPAQPHSHAAHHHRPGGPRQRPGGRRTWSPRRAQLRGARDGRGDPRGRRHRHSPDPAAVAGRPGRRSSRPASTSWSTARTSASGCANTSCSGCSSGSPTTSDTTGCSAPNPASGWRPRSTRPPAAGRSRCRRSTSSGSSRPVPGFPVPTRSPGRAVLGEAARTRRGVGRGDRTRHDVRRLPPAAGQRGQLSRAPPAPACTGR